MFSLASIKSKRALKTVRKLDAGPSFDSDSEAEELSDEGREQVAEAMRHAMENTEEPSSDVATKGDESEEEDNIVTLERDIETAYEEYKKRRNIVVKKRRAKLGFAEEEVSLADFGEPNAQDEQGASPSDESESDSDESPDKHALEVEQQQTVKESNKEKAKRCEKANVCCQSFVHNLSHCSGGSSAICLQSLKTKMTRQVPKKKRRIQPLNVEPRSRANRLPLPLRMQDALGGVL